MSGRASAVRERSPIATCAKAWGYREDQNEPTRSTPLGIATVVPGPSSLGQGVSGDDRGVAIC